MERRRWRFALLLCLIVLPFAEIFLLRPELRAAANFLEKAGEPCPAEIAVVLAGDATGFRLEKASSLVKAGLVPRILVSAPDGFYGLNEADLAIPFMVRKGYPENWFIAYPHSARSTREEVRLLLAELARRGIHSFDLVTSNYHTRRTSAILARAHTNLTYCVVAAPDQVFRPEDWWRNREARKIFFFEWTKTFADWLGGG